jgi:hypothetical protein
MIPLNSGTFKIRETITSLWCRLMHDAATWPVHGHYQCRTCRRLYPVPWAETLISHAGLPHHTAGASLDPIRRVA